MLGDRDQLPANTYGATEGLPHTIFYTLDPRSSRILVQ